MEDVLLLSQVVFPVKSRLPYLIQYKPLYLNDLNSDIQAKFSQINFSDIPQVDQHQVYMKILSAKKPNSSVPGDIPKRIIQEFAVELSAPATIIFNNSLKQL